jgi:helicase MOV-10
MFRLNAPSRSKGHLPVALAEFSRVVGETFAVPPLDELKKFRVIVSTCLSSFVPYGIGFTRGHFSHIFVDEAGQASEPEALIAIKSLANKDTNVILSGDPKQLGPIIRSDLAIRLGLSVSFLDRLIKMPLYDEDSKSGITYVTYLFLAQ